MRGNRAGLPRPAHLWQAWGLRLRPAQRLLLLQRSRPLPLPLLRRGLPRRSLLRLALLLLLPLLQQVLLLEQHRWWIPVRQPEPRCPLRLGRRRRQLRQCGIGQPWHRRRGPGPARQVAPGPRPRASAGCSRSCRHGRRYEVAGRA